MFTLLIVALLIEASLLCWVVSTRSLPSIASLVIISAVMWCGWYMAQPTAALWGSALLAVSCFVVIMDAAEKRARAKREAAKREAESVTR